MTHPFRAAYIPVSPPASAEDIANAVAIYFAPVFTAVTGITTRDLEYVRLAVVDDGAVVRIYRYDADNTDAEDGETVILDSQDRPFVLVGSIPNAGIPASASGAATVFPAPLEEEITVDGATTDTTIEIPDRAIVFAVTTRTTEAITGATSYDCGIVGETDKFGATLGIALDSTNSGVIAPTAYYAATAVRLTANGGNFSGGKVRVAIHYMLCTAPTS
jgi:hypothetical protein